MESLWDTVSLGNQGNIFFYKNNQCNNHYNDVIIIDDKQSSLILACYLLFIDSTFIH